MTTNILVLPVTQVTVLTRTNEDWIDGLAYFYDEAATMPITLEGIYFEMEMRHLTPDATVILRGNSEDGTMLVNENTLMLNYPVERVSAILPMDYVFDVIMKADGRQRVLVQGTVTVTQGVTR